MLTFMFLIISMISIALFTGGVNTFFKFLFFFDYKTMKRSAYLAQKYTILFPGNIYIYQRAIFLKIIALW